MTRMQVYIPDEMFSDLKRYSRINEVAMSEVVRKGLDKVLGAKKPTKLKFGEGFFGAYKGHIKTDAVNDIHNYYKNDAI